MKTFSVFLIVLLLVLFMLSFQPIFNVSVGSHGRFGYADGTNFYGVSFRTYWQRYPTVVGKGVGHMGHGSAFQNPGNSSMAPNMPSGSFDKKFANCTPTVHN